MQTNTDGSHTDAPAGGPAPAEVLRDSAPHGPLPPEGAPQDGRRDRGGDSGRGGWSCVRAGASLFIPAKGWAQTTFPQELNPAHSQQPGAEGPRRRAGFHSWGKVVRARALEVFGGFTAHHWFLSPLASHALDDRAGRSHKVSLAKGERNGEEAVMGNDGNPGRHQKTERTKATKRNATWDSQVPRARVAAVLLSFFGCLAGRVFVGILNHAPSKKQATEEGRRNDNPDDGRARAGPACT